MKSKSKKKTHQKNLEKNKKSFKDKLYDILQTVITTAIILILIFGKYILPYSYTTAISIFILGVSCVIYLYRLKYPHITTSCINDSITVIAAVMNLTIYIMLVYDYQEVNYTIISFLILLLSAVIIAVMALFLFKTSLKTPLKKIVFIIVSSIILIPVISSINTTYAVKVTNISQAKVIDKKLKRGPKNSRKYYVYVADDDISNIGSKFKCTGSIYSQSNIGKPIYIYYKKGILGLSFAQLL